MSCFDCSRITVIRRLVIGIPRLQGKASDDIQNLAVPNKLGQLQHSQSMNQE
jgi:hypothetical protein